MNELNETDEVAESPADVDASGESAVAEPELYHIELSDGGAVDYARREDDLGWNWSVSDAEGDVLEYGRDKTELDGDGIKHHAVNELSSATDASRGWSTNEGGKTWNNWDQ